MKELEKLGQKQVSKVTLHFVWAHFSRKQTVVWLGGWGGWGGWGGRGVWGGWGGWDG